MGGGGGGGGGAGEVFSSLLLFQQVSGIIERKSYFIDLLYAIFQKNVLLLAIQTLLEESIGEMGAVPPPLPQKKKNTIAG